jgi:predicted nicotinamide N-methyase
MEGGTDIEARVWDAGVLVARLIAGAGVTGDGLAAVSDMVQAMLRNKLVIDVGAGTGIAGIACAVTACPKAVALTDLPCAIPRLAQNAELNNLVAVAPTSRASAPTLCRTLSWGDEPALRSAVAAMAPGMADSEAFHNTVLLLADVVYEPEGFEPLAATLYQALSSGAEGILVYRHRRTEAVDFFSQIAALGISVTLVAGDDEVQAAPASTGKDSELASKPLRSHAMSIYRLRMG